MSSRDLKSSTINTIRKRDEEVFKKAIKGYKRLLSDQQKKTELFLNFIPLDILPVLPCMANTDQHQCFQSMSEKSEPHSC